MATQSPSPILYVWGFFVFLFFGFNSSTNYSCGIWAELADHWTRAGMPWAQVPAVLLISCLSVSVNGNPTFPVPQAQNLEISLDSTLKIPTCFSSKHFWKLLISHLLHHNLSESSASVLAGLLQQLPSWYPHFRVCRFKVRSLYSSPGDLFKSCQNILFLCPKFSSVLSFNSEQKVKYWQGLQ